VLDGKSVHAIAARLKRTTGAVRCRASILGLSVAADKTVRDQRNGREQSAPLRQDYITEN
jgi:hypothetical protein